MKTYREVQSFNVRLILAVIGVAVLVVIYGAYSQLYEGISFGNMPSNSTSSLITLAVLIVLGILLIKARLHTTINEEGVYVKLFPLQLQWRHTHWAEIDQLEIVQFDAVGDYGGYGIRFSLSGKGVAYIVEGNSGLHIHRKHKKPLLIGTQRTAEMLERLEEWRKKLK
jgi:hypothetical protein